MKPWCLLVGLFIACNGSNPDVGATTEDPATTAKEGCLCGAIYAPVCANGVTYGNKCEAECKGITEVEEGACPPMSGE